jgi:hypothetical protein
MRIVVLDPALCCSTGVCGPDVDDALIQTSANVKWLKSLGHDVHRYNVSNDADAFKKYPAVIDKLTREGINSLPYNLLEGRLVLSGRYPDKSEWEALVSGSQVNGNGLTDQQTIDRTRSSSGDMCC